LALLVIALYPYLLFVDVSQERQRNWSENRPFPSLYWTTWDEPPEFGLFGFPHQAGWRAVGQLLSEDQLPYASNEEREITSWYTGHALRTHCPNFKTLIIAENAQDEVPIEPSWFDGLNLNVKLLVLGQETMRLYGREYRERPRLIDASKATNWFSPDEIAPPVRKGAYPVGITFGSKASLLGYDIDQSSARPNGQVVVTLYWQALEPFERNYQVFVHLAGEKHLAQHDGAPECAVNPTTRWEPGEIIVDPHIVDIPSDFQPQKVQLLVGMYDLLTEARLPLANNDTDALLLSELHIEDAG
jgi:hypothetical protein